MRSACSTNMPAPAARCRSRPRAGTGPAGLRRRRATIARAQLFRARGGHARAVLRPTGARAARADRPCPAGTPSLLVTDAQRQAFNQKRLVRAVRLLGQQGRSEQRPVHPRLSEDLDSDAGAAAGGRTGERRSGGRTLRCGPPGRRATPATPSITRRPIRPIRPMSRPAAPGRWSMALPARNRASTRRRSAMPGRAA